MLVGTVYIHPFADNAGKHVCEGGSRFVLTPDVHVHVVLVSCCSVSLLVSSLVASGFLRLIVIIVADGQESLCAYTEARNLPQLAREEGGY